MKRKSILFSLLTVMCFGAVAGCGEVEYAITAQTPNAEYGYITGSGDYEMGDTVEFKIYSNMGCSLTGIKFINSKDEVTNITQGWESVDNKYDFYSFVVKNETIGTYEPIYSCASKPASGIEVTGGYKVTYLVDLNGDGDVADERENQEEQVNSGSTALKVDYLDKEDGAVRVMWYTDEERTNPYDFSNIVNNNMTLYGKITEMNKLEIVKEALNNFYAWKKVSISGDGKSLVVDNLNDKTKMSFSYKSEDSNQADVTLRYTTIGTNPVQYLYIYDTKEGQYIKSEVKSSGVVTLDNIKDIYVNPFIAFEKENIENLKDDDVNFLDGKYVVNGVALTIEKGILKSFVKDEKEYEVQEDKSTFSVLSLDIPVFYTVRLASSNDDLNEEISKFNVLDKVLKVVPNKGQTVETVIKSNEDISSLLSKYGYSWYKYDEANKTCSSQAYDLKSKVENHLYLCADVTASIYSVIDAYEKLKTPNYTITTKLITDDEFQVQDKVWAANVDITTVESKPDGIATATWNTLEKLKKLNGENGYFKIEYDNQTKEILIYLCENSKFAELKVLLDEDGSLKTVKYSVDASGDIITYSNEFTYSTSE